MNQLEQSLLTSNKALRTLNHEIEERRKYQITQEKQISDLFEQGNDILLSLNDVILQRKYTVTELENQIVSLKAQIDELIIDNSVVLA